MEIRNVAEDEFDQLAALLGIAFLDDASESRIDRFRKLLEFDRTFGAFDGPELVGSISAFTFDISVPGGRSVPMAGTTIIAVKPTHRRRGLLRRLMSAHFEDVVARGEPLAGLWASETQIYGRFGYGWATDSIDAEISSSAVLTGTTDDSVTMRMVDQEAFLNTAPALYERIRLGEPGTVSRSEDWWLLRRCDDDPETRSGASATRYVIASRNGEPAGYVAYRTKDEYRDGVSNGEVRIREVAAVDLDAELAIWSFILSIDLTTKIKVRARPIDDPLLYRLENSRVYQRKVTDALYLALLDVQAALEGRTYSAPGSLAIEITDQDTAGVYALTVHGDGAATCAPSTVPADIAMEARTLGSVYLGGRRINTMAQAGRITGTAAAIALADRMFLGERAPVIRDVF